MQDEEKNKPVSSGLIEDEEKKPEVPEQKQNHQDDELLEDEKVQEKEVVEEKVVDTKLLEKKEKYLAILNELSTKELKNVEI